MTTAQRADAAELPSSSTPSSQQTGGTTSASTNHLATDDLDADARAATTSSSSAASVPDQPDGGLSGATTVASTVTPARDLTRPLSTTATVDSATDDPAETTKADAVPAAAAPSADLSVTKSLSPAVPVPGSAVTFTITVANAGPSLAAAVTVTDQLDPALGDVTAIVDNGGSCTVAVDRLLECSLGDLDPGDGVVTVTVTATLAADFTGTLTNTAAVGSPTADPVTDDNTDSATGDAVPSADVSIATSATPTAPVPGERVTYILTVDNDGPSTAAGVTVDDQLDPALSGATVTTTQGTCDPVGAANALSCAVGVVDPDDDPVTITVTATLSSTFTGTLSNTATVAATTPDPDPGNNTDTATGDAQPSADLSIVKTVSPQVPVPGLPVTYTLTVDNDGPSTATATSVEDVLDAALTGATVTTSAGTCDPVGADNTVSCTPGSLDPAADPVTITVTATLAPDHTGTLSNTASVESPTPDPDTADNTDTITTPTGPNADLSIVKTVNPQAPVAGAPVTYTLTVHNDGPSTATGVTLSDRLDDALLAPSATATVGSCAPIGADGEVTCTLGSLISGQTATVTVTATVAEGATGALTNTATVSSALLDVDQDDNTDTVTSDLVSDADLSLVKDVSASEATAGDDVVFTLAVSNAGPSTARDVVVTDPLPSGLRVSGIPESDAGSCTVSGRTVTCTVNDLAAGETTEIRVTATVLASAEGGSVTNTASVATSSNDRVDVNDRDSAVLAVAAPQGPPAPGAPNPPPPVAPDPCPSCPGGLAHTGEALLPQSGLGFGLLLAGLLLSWAARRRAGLVAVREVRRRRRDDDQTAADSGRERPLATAHTRRPGANDIRHDFSSRLSPAHTISSPAARLLLEFHCVTTHPP